VVAAKVVVDMDREMDGGMNRVLRLSLVLVLVLGQVLLNRAVDASLILARFLGSLRIVIERDR
jgi:hypothetical protein